MNISVSIANYGPLQQGFSFEVKDGYSVLIGPNDLGKSAILQLIFSKLVRDVHEIGPEKVCIILPERIFVEISTETGNKQLQNHNTDLAGTIATSVLTYQNWNSPPQNELLRLLLTHSNFVKQVGELNKYLERVGLPEAVIGKAQNISFEGVPVVSHGSGIRSMLPILAALTDPTIEVLLIDEPELSLEPKLQKMLRDILLEQSETKRIIISTHSHLFINRGDYSSNYVVNKNDEVTAKPLSSQSELFDLVFTLLGNSVQDLFFPGNFLIVEGASDQVIMEKALELLEIKNDKIKVVSASSIGNVGNIYKSISNTLLPLVMDSSPYSQKVVALIDKPRKENDKELFEIKKVLKERLFELSSYSIEEYLPDALYTRAGRNKKDDLKVLTQAKDKGDYQSLSELKKELSNALALSLNKTDLENLKTLNEAIEKASE